jgi:hypothetical protein
MLQSDISRRSFLGRIITVGSCVLLFTAKPLTAMKKCVDDKVKDNPACKESDRLQKELTALREKIGGLVLQAAKQLIEIYKECAGG